MYTEQEKLEEGNIVEFQEDIYGRIIAHAHSKGLTTEEEHKNKSTTPDRLIELINSTNPITLLRVLGEKNIRAIREDERLETYMPDKVYETLRKRVLIKPKP